MKNIDEIDENINELILQKSFDKLTVEEKEKITAYVGGQEEYNSLRTTLLAITTSFNTEEEAFVDQDLKTNLLNQFEKKFGSSGSRAKVIPLYRNPLFQLAVAASVALLIFFAFPFFNENSSKQGQLAMNPSKESTVAPAGTIDEKIIPDMSLEHKNEAPAVEKSLNDTRSENGLLENIDAENEGPLKTANSITPVLDNNRGDELKQEEDLNAKDELAKSVDTKSKPNNKLDGVVNNTNTNDDFMYERVMRERKEAEASKGKKKEKSADRDKDIAPSSTNSKNDVDKKVLESATGNVYAENVTMAPSNTAVSGKVNTFVEENKTEILDLLFTTF